MTRLLPTGLAIFAIGVVVNYAGGEDWKMPALVLQLIGVGFLFANAGRSRKEATRDASDNDEEA